MIETDYRVQLHVACMEEKCTRGFVGKAKGENLLGRQACRCEDRIKMYLVEIESKCKD
jgi:hypothetical protein